MACRYTYKGKTYSVAEFDDVLKALPLAEAAKFMPAVTAIPSAPFVTKTEAWVALSLKRMIRYAAENGFDKVAWTTGEQQAARYDLSKHIDKVEYTTNADKTIHIEASQGSKAVWVDKQSSIKVIEDTLGKEIAKKISESGRTYGTLLGIDLKVGDEGMKAFYDKIVPNIANEVLRKLGGGRVEQVKIGVPHDALDYRTEIDSRGIPHAYDYEDTQSNQPGFTITPELATRAAEGLPLFSKAAVALEAIDHGQGNINYQAEAAKTLNDLMRRYEGGELDHTQYNNAVMSLLDKTKLTKATGTQLFGAAWEQMAGGAQQWANTWINSPGYIGHFSKAFKNVHNLLMGLDRYKSTQLMTWTKEALSSWHDGSSTHADEVAVGEVMMKITSEDLAEGTKERTEAEKDLTPQQRRMFNQGNVMIAGLLNKEFESDSANWLKSLPAEDAAKLIKSRKEQLQGMLGKYTPERRYGNHMVNVYFDGVDKNGRPEKMTVAFEAHEHAYQAEKAAAEYQNTITLNGANLKVESGVMHKTSRDTTISLQQFLDTARRNGVEISQTERERIVKALTESDSLRRNRLMRRKNVPGYSEDIVRVMHEFAMGIVSKLAYNKFSSMIDAASEGKPVDVQTVNEKMQSIEPAFKVDESRNLWKDDGPKSGMYRNISDRLVDYNLVPDHTGAWSRNMRATAMTYFIAGSLAQGATNAMQTPMVTIPTMSQYTGIGRAATLVFGAWKDVWMNVNILRDLKALEDPTVSVPVLDRDPGLRQALITAAKDGRTMDTEVHAIMGISQGTKLAQSRTTQKAMDVFMSPFRIGEQTNRLTAFIAAYRAATTGEGIKQADGSTQKLSGRALYEFSGKLVDDSQFVYGAANRPGLSQNPVGALFMMFKSFPLFMMEAMHVMYKQNPKSLVYMLLGLTAASGIQGLPLAGTLEDLIDTIAYRVFGSPFNTKRAMRNFLKDASEAAVGADLSQVALHGMFNDILGFDAASHLGAGSFIPGTRIGTADADYGRSLEQIAGAPFGMAATMVRAGKPLLKGDFLAAIEQGGPVSLRNLLKGAGQLEQGFSVDSRGNKVTDASPFNAAWQSIGFSSATAAKMLEMDRMDTQTKAAYTAISADMTSELIQAVKANDQEKIQEIENLRAAWNERYPEMPMMRQNIRRELALSGLSLPERRFMMLPRAMRGGSMAAEELR